MRKIRELQDRDVRKLVVYQKSLDLVKEISIIKEALPWREKNILGDQIWRSATSISGNISEGATQVFFAVYFKHLSSALGSCGETCTWLEILSQCGYIDKTTFDALYEKVIEIRRILLAIMKKILVEIQDEKEVA
ncbi:four helix bundle protein [Brevibacillus choshinensis]|uniref:Four helix bundle protein n=1 Tax=Brevibacillus choshinensis TaxID=54911 RepID=A0ABX7FIB6_BRECH|nr:four helix bundle protein [Brevibacillus choshinensis]QRG65959.1 four helix bundle protein [Brevibacillus choshinensis]